MDKESLRITKGGGLVKTSWNRKKGVYESKDVTGHAVSKTFDRCELEDGVTLKDIFLLLNTELMIFDTIIGNWCEEIVTLGLSEKGKPYGEYDPEGIEYLELYHMWGIEKFKDEAPNFWGNIFPDFHGVGFKLKEDKMFEWGEVEWPKGERIPWGICLTDILDLINIPLKLDTTVEITEDDYTKKAKGYKDKILIKLENVSYSLGQILYGVLWELSFHGGPESAKKTKEMLNDMVKEIKTKNLTKGKDSATIEDSDD